MNQLQPTSQTLRILVVDDVPDVRTTLHVLLALWGHEVREAEDGPTALEVARELRPHIVFLDLGLPGMDGSEVARRLRTLSGLEDSLIVALTGFPVSARAAEARAAGCDRYLLKPADPDEIRRLLCQWQWRWVAAD